MDQTIGDKLKAAQVVLGEIVKCGSAKKANEMLNIVYSLLADAKEAFGNNGLPKPAPDHVDVT